MTNFLGLKFRSTLYWHADETSWQCQTHPTEIVLQLNLKPHLVLAADANPKNIFTWPRFTYHCNWTQKHAFYIDASADSNLTNFPARPWFTHQRSEPTLLCFIKNKILEKWISSRCWYPVQWLRFWIEHQATQYSNVLRFGKRYSGNSPRFRMWTISTIKKRPAEHQRAPR